MATVERLELQRLCLETQLRADRYREGLAAFLRQHQSALELAGDDDIVREFLVRVWPSGLPSTMIVTSVSTNEHGRWLIRPPIEGSKAASFAAGGLTPAFSCYRRQGRLVVDQFVTVAHVAPRPCETILTAIVHIDPKNEYIERDDWSKLESLPNIRDDVQEELRPWLEYLDWREKLLHLQQTAIRYNRVEGGPNNTVRIHTAGALDQTNLRRELSSSLVLAAPLSASRSPDVWEPDLNQRPRLTRLGTVTRVDAANAPTRASKRRGPSFHQAANKKVPVIITAEPEDGEDAESILRNMPEEGFLVSAIFAELKPLRTERNSIRRFLRGEGCNPYLAAWLFNVQNAGLPGARADIDEDILDRLDPDQLDALIKMLDAPDLALIQGPPGTGKTYLITAAAQALARAGKRVLIVSQTNLAVDNVLAGLQHPGPTLPLRIGKPDRVEPEAKDCLKDRVVAIRFTQIRQLCEGQLRDGDDVQRLVRRAHERFATLRSLLQRMNELDNQLNTITEELGAAQSRRQEAQHTAQTNRRVLEEHERDERALATLAQWLVQPTSQPPAIGSLADDDVLDGLDAVRVTLRDLTVDLPWQPRWLAHGKGTSLAELAATIHRASFLAQTPSSTAINDAIGLCYGPGGVNDERLNELHAAKRRLQDSEEERDLLRLGQINREIKRLRDEQWSRLCRAIHESLSAVLDDPFPDELDALLTSLHPDPSFVSTLERIRRFQLAARRSAAGSLENHLPRIREKVTDAQERVASELESARAQLSESQGELAAIETEMEQIRETQADVQSELRSIRERWNELWPETCPDLTEAGTVPDPSPEALQNRQQAFDAWCGRQRPEWERRQRWQEIQREWIERLGDTHRVNRRDLQELYCQQANVVGMTCTQAGQRDVYERPEFAAFDVVIVDEVSKATPTELLIAMMLGLKVVLVGDHRQLPPMFRENEHSYADAVAEGLIDPDDFRKYERLVTASLFQSLYESAPEELRHTLWRNYRSHPAIIEVNNQFYDGRLIPAGGAAELAAKRSHHLTIPDVRGGLLLEPHHAVQWIDSTRDARGRVFTERQRGTSKVNLLEARLVEEVLVRLNHVLAQRGYGNPVDTEADRDVDELPIEAWTRRLLATAPDETIGDLFRNSKVRLNGRAAPAGTLVRSGDRITVDARKSVGVITFYGAQLGEIRRRLAEATRREPAVLSALDVRTNTVDRFQGMERPIVIVSLVRARPYLHGGAFVKQFQRINVALSRAQELLIIIGSEATFRDALIDLPPLNGGPTKPIPVYRNIYDIVQRHGGRRYAKQLLR